MKKNDVLYYSIQKLHEAFITSNHHPIVYRSIKIKDSGYQLKNIMTDLKRSFGLTQSCNTGIHASSSNTSS